MYAAAARYRFANRLVTTGRGYSYPAACEGALKLMETSYLSAHAFSTADLLHGPVAMLDSAVPVIAVVSPGRGGDAARPVVDRLRDTGADVLVVGAGDLPIASDGPAGGAAAGAGDPAVAATRLAAGDRPRAATRTVRAACRR